MTAFNQAIRTWVTWVVYHPKSTVLLSLLVCALVMSGIPDIRFSPSPRHFQGKDSPGIQRLEAMEAEYVQDNNILIMLRPGSDTPGSVFDPGFLSVVRSMTEQAWTLPHVQRVDSLTNFQHIRAQGDDLIVRDLVPDTENLTATDIETIRQAALTEPALAGFLVSADGDAVGINLILNIDISDAEAIYLTSEAADTLVAEQLRGHQTIQANITGAIPVSKGWLDAIVKDVSHVYLATLVVILVSLTWFFRSPGAAVSALFIGLVSVVCGLSFVGHLNGELFPPTSVGVLMILMLALADTIHVGNATSRYLAQGHDRKQAIVKSVTFNFSAIGLTSVTTAIGFLSFYSSEFSGTRTMGGYVAFGVMMAWLLSISLLPALLTWCRLKPRQRQASNPAYLWLANQVLKYRKFILLITLPGILISLYCISFNELDENMARFVGKHEPMRVNMSAVENNLTGVSSIIFNLSADETNGVSDPEFMRQVDAFVAWARAHPRIRHVSSYTDTMKRLNREMHGGDPGFYGLPEQRNLAAQYLLLYELSLPFGLDLTNQINMDKSATRVVLSINDLSMSDIIELGEEAEQWMNIHAPLLAGSRANGSNVNGAYMVMKNMENMIYGAIMALTIIGTILLFVYRAFRPGLLSVIMVISPVVVAFGIWGVTVGAVGLAAGIAVCMVIGIVVDNAVHFMNKYLYATRESGESTEDGIRYAMTTVGPALFTNTVVLSLGFGLFWFSAFKLNAIIGAMTVLSVVITLVGTFTLLPSLLMIRNKAAQATESMRQPVTDL